MHHLLSFPLPASSSSEFRKTLHRIAVFALVLQLPCLISGFLPGALFQTRVNYLPALATKSGVIQNINLRYRSHRASPADTIYAL